MKKLNQYTVCLAILLSLFYFSCTATKKNDTSVTKNTTVETIKGSNSNNEVDEIIYRYSGPSVHPMYSRSYIINLNRQKKKLTVDSTKTRTINFEKNITVDQFDKLVSLFKHYNIQYTKDIESDGCTGGSGQTILLKSQEKEIFRGNTTRCGGFEKTNLSGNVEAYIAAIKKVAFE
jgi:hypothetical protein